MMIGGTVLKVTGMSCEHCEKRVEKAVSAVAGVQKCRADAKKGTLTYKGGDAEAIKVAVKEAGYGVE